MCTSHKRSAHCLLFFRAVQQTTRLRLHSSTLQMNAIESKEAAVEGKGR